jgi:hypothetical protein
MVKLRLSKAQMQKAMRGQTVQIKHEDIGVGHDFELHPMTVKKIMTAHKKGKGVRIILSQEEIEGSGILDFFRDIGKKIVDGAQWVKTKVIDTPFYQQTVRPVAKAVVSQAYDSVIRPALPSSLGDKGKDIVNLVGDKTGAFGVRSMSIPSARKSFAEWKAAYPVQYAPPDQPSFESQDGMPSKAEYLSMQQFSGLVDKKPKKAKKVSKKKGKKASHGAGFRLA